MTRGYGTAVSKENRRKMEDARLEQQSLPVKVDSRSP